MRCCISMCTSNQIKERTSITSKTGISFHQIPSNMFIRNLWIQKISTYQNTQPWKPDSDFTRICSLHFRPSDYVKRDLKIKKLKPEAVPSIFDVHIEHKLGGRRTEKSRPVPILTNDHKSREDIGLIKEENNSANIVHCNLTESTFPNQSLDHFNRCSLCWKMFLMENETQCLSDFSPIYLNQCKRYLDLEIDVHGERKADKNNRICSNCLKSAKELTNIVESLDKLQNQIDAFSSSLSMELKNLRRKYRAISTEENLGHTSLPDEVHLLENGFSGDVNDEFEVKFEIDDDDDDENLSVAEPIASEDEYFDEQNVETLKNTIPSNFNKDELKRLTIQIEKLNDCFGPTVYYCSTCCTLWKDKQTFREHSKTHKKRISKPEKDFICVDCGKIFSQWTFLREHYISGHTNDRPFKCSSCPKSFKFKAQLTRHEFNHKTGKTNCCDICGKDFLYAKNLKYHTDNGHKPEKVAQSEIKSVGKKCTICNKEFRYNTLLRMHVTRAHNIPGRFKCQDCPKSFAVNFDLKRHKATHDKRKNPAISKGRIRKNWKPKPLTCGICGVVITSGKIAFEDHKKLHTGEKPFKCDICDEYFRTKLNLRVHQIQEHENEYPFPCEQCDMKFKMKKQLRDHLVTMHSSLDEHIICEDCGKSFKRQGDYITHRGRVHENKEYKCEQCDKSFGRITERNHHVKLVHTKEIAFVCDICGRECTSTRKLNDHIRTHTGEKPFKCAECGKCFFSNTSLSGHRKTSHK